MGGWITDETINPTNNKLYHDRL